MIDQRLLERFVPLDSLSSGSRSKLAQRLELSEARAGDILFRLGDPMGMTLYLVDGSVRLNDSAGQGVVVHGGQLAARQALTSAPIQRAEACCISACRYLAIDPEMLDVVLTWDQGRALDINDAGKDAGDDDDWMIRLLQLPVFHRVPPGNLYAMFRRFETIVVVAGEVLIRQGDSGDYFYVVVEGRCSILRAGLSGEDITLAELERGACFGEEALISDEPRNATATMLTGGRLMRLAKQDFRDLLSDPLARTISFSEAKERVSAGTARWLDVRLATEYPAGSPDHSINLPLHLLRLKLPELDPKLAYIAICDTGRRSSVAVWLLGKHGFDAYRLHESAINDQP